MQVNSSSYINVNTSALDKATANAKDKFNTVQEVSNKTSEKTPMEEIENAAVQVTLSMNAQIILFSLDASELSKGNSEAQGQIFDILSGKDIDGGFSLQDLGYEGKPITELSVEEATDLISEDGFFGIGQTSQRVADFVFSFAGDDIDLLEKGRAGIVQGFEEAQKMWGDELPQISHDTQSKTLELLDKRINELKDNS
ncbi:MAG: hydrogenase-4 component G [Arcobacteraceae bacterium]|nr:hydrogenase-4 component G [Arcobacteraceae bacterium]